MANIAIGSEVGLERGKPVLVHTGWQREIPLIKTMYIIGWSDDAQLVKVAYPRPTKERGIVIRRSQIMGLPPNLTHDQEALRPVQSDEPLFF